jgi:hypothetical protein
MLTSAMFTLIPIGLFFLVFSAPTGLLMTVGMVFGPATGQIYGGLEGRAVLGIGLRGLAAAGCLVAMSHDNQDILGIFLSALLILDLIDVLSVGSLVHKRNEALRKAALTLGPAYVPNNKGVGIQFRLSF